MQEDDRGLGALVGAWRLCSLGLTWSDNGERTEIYGANPDGYMVLGPSGRVMFIFGPRDRRPPTNDTERAALFATLTAYTGRVRLDGPGRIVTAVDYAWSPALSGEQVRFFRLSGDRLEIRTPNKCIRPMGTEDLSAI